MSPKRLQVSSTLTVLVSVFILATGASLYYNNSSGASYVTPNKPTPSPNSCAYTNLPNDNTPQMTAEVAADNIIEHESGGAEGAQVGAAASTAAGSATDTLVNNVFSALKAGKGAQSALDSLASYVNSKADELEGNFNSDDVNTLVSYVDNAPLSPKEGFSGAGVALRANPGVGTAGYHEYKQVINNQNVVIRVVVSANLVDDENQGRPGHPIKGSLWLGYGWPKGAPQCKTEYNNYFIGLLDSGTTSASVAYNSKAYVSKELNYSKKVEKGSY